MIRECMPSACDTGVIAFCRGKHHAVCAEIVLFEKIARDWINRLNMSAYDLSIWVLPLIIAITFHEAAHGFVAYAFGDDTAMKLGRVSINPIRHIDPFGTL